MANEGSIASNLRTSHEASDIKISSARKKKTKDRILKEKAQTVSVANVESN